VAFYRTLVQPGSWQARLLRNRSQLLNRKPLKGHAGSQEADAFYYDPHDYAKPRSSAIVKRLRAIGYDGIFLDTTTFESVHPDALAEYQRRHNEPYDAGVARFLKALRAKDVLIVTNQGYRAAGHYLPYAHYDVTESLLSRPWHDEGNRWNSVDFLIPQMIVPAAERYPDVRFVHLNYGSDVERIVATALLFEQEAFVASHDVQETVFSDLYFVDLGKATGEIERDGLTWTRAFERGRVIVSPAGGKLERAIP
jgi:L-rhamnose mutarotase